jgi:hypothetical protein
MMKLKIHKLDDDSVELYHKYPGQANPQPVYISLDCRTGELSVDWSGEIGRSMPMSVYNKLTLRWEITPVKGYAANRLMDHIADNCQLILDGSKSEEEIIAWDAYQWIDTADIEQRGLWSGTTDQELDELADELILDARCDGIGVLEDLKECLEAHREKLQEETLIYK